MPPSTLAPSKLLFAYGGRPKNSRPVYRDLTTGGRPPWPNDKSTAKSGPSGDFGKICCCGTGGTYERSMARSATTNPARHEDRLNCFFSLFRSSISPNLDLVTDRVMSWLYGVRSLIKSGFPLRSFRTFSIQTKKIIVDKFLVQKSIRLLFKLLKDCNTSTPLIF